MKVVIFAGGLGTRFSEETVLRPKPMIEIGGMPILWHIMKQYSAYGLNEFIICAGYKQEIIKDFFANYHLHRSSVTFDIKNNQIDVHNSGAEDWKVTVVDTGLDSLTAGRLVSVKDYIGDESFCLTYGDGVSNIHILKLIKYHQKKGKALTLSAVKPPARFGALEINDGIITKFAEKDPDHDILVNGGFMVAEPSIFDYIKGDGKDAYFEKQPMEDIVAAGELAAYEHQGFWQCMDKLYDKQYLEQLWDKDEAPWKIW